MLGRDSPSGPATMKNWLPPELGAPVLAMATDPSGYWVERVRRLGRVLVLDGVAGAALPVPGRVTGLVHELGDDPMEDHAVVVALVGQEHEVVDGDGGRLGVQGDVERARGRS